MSAPDHGHLLTQRLRLDPLRQEDAAAVLAYELRNRADFAPHGPLRRDVDFHPEAAFLRAQEQLRELIRQNFHHPAIFFWSIGNETFVRDPKTIAPDTNDRLLRELAAVVREEDDTRLSTYASNGDVREPRASHPNIIGFNHYFGWYDGALDDFAVWADQQHAASVRHWSARAALRRRSRGSGRWHNDRSFRR